MSEEILTSLDYDKMDSKVLMARAMAGDTEAHQVLTERMDKDSEAKDKRVAQLEAERDALLARATTNLTPEVEEELAEAEAILKEEAYEIAPDGFRAKTKHYATKAVNGRSAKRTKSMLYTAGKDELKRTAGMAGIAATRNAIFEVFLLSASEEKLPMLKKKLEDKRVIAAWDSLIGLGACFGLNAVSVRSHGRMSDSMLVAAESSGRGAIAAVYNGLGIQDWLEETFQVRDISDAFPDDELKEMADNIREGGLTHNLI